MNFMALSGVAATAWPMGVGLRIKIPGTRFIAAAYDEAVGPEGTIYPVISFVPAWWKRPNAPSDCESQLPRFNNSPL